MKSKILTHGESKNTERVLLDFKIPLEKKEEIMRQLIQVQYKHFTDADISLAIKLCHIPLIDNEGKEKIIAFQINPLQDFLDEDILVSMRNYQTLDKLNINMREVEIGKNGYTYCTQRDEVFHTLQQHPDLMYKIMDTYYGIYKFLLQWLHGSKDLIKLRQNTSLEIWKNLYDYTTKNKGPDDEVRAFDEFDYPLLTDDSLISFSLMGKGFKDIYDNYKESLGKITSHFKGGHVGENINVYLQQQEEQKNELEQMIFTPLQEGTTELILDGKYLYMDNGHHLYKNILDKSAYHEYVQQEMELIDFCGKELNSLIYGKYVGLGVGSGEKDFHLLHYQQFDTSSVFIDSSLTSLQEAEVLCKKSPQRASFGQTHVDNVFFSKNWISDLAHGKDLSVVLGTFAQTSPPMTWNLQTLQDGHSFYSMLGGTYGNFSSEYKLKFLQDMNMVMSDGDHMLLSVFDKPKTEEDIDTILNHYNTEENFEFVSNFFEKIGISKENIELKVYYKDNKVCIDAVINPYEQDIEIKCYGKSIKVTEPVTVKIFRSERFGEDTMQEYIDTAGTELKIGHVIEIPGNPYKFYILKK